MALISPSFFPRSMFDMDKWVKDPFRDPFFKEPLNTLSTLDVFDPFDELDNFFSRNLTWLNRPSFLPVSYPRVPQKYRISIDCAGYRPDSIKTDMKEGNKLIVTAHEEDRREGQEDFSVREFRKTYQLPSNAEKDKLVSFMTAGGRLVIEVPLKETETSRNEDLFPQITDSDQGKQVTARFSIPSHIDPSKVNVSVKDRDLIVRAEDKVDKPDGVSRYYYYKRTTLPENTRFDQLKCNLDNNVVSINAPVDANYRSAFRTIPIEHPAQQQQQLSGRAQQQLTSGTQQQQWQQPQQQQWQHTQHQQQHQQHQQKS